MGRRNRRTSILCTNSWHEAWGAGKQLIEHSDDYVRAKGIGKYDNGWDMPRGGGEMGGRRYSEHSLERMAPDTI